MDIQIQISNNQIQFPDAHSEKLIQDITPEPPNCRNGQNTTDSSSASHKIQPAADPNLNLLDRGIIPQVELQNPSRSVDESPRLNPRHARATEVGAKQDHEPDCSIAKAKPDLDRKAVDVCELRRVSEQVRKENRERQEKEVADLLEEQKRQEQENLTRLINQIPDLVEAAAQQGSRNAEILRIPPERSRGYQLYDRPPALTESQQKIFEHLVELGLNPSLNPLFNDRSQSTSSGRLSDLTNNSSDQYRPKTWVIRANW